MTPLETGWGLQRGWAAVINKGPSAPFSPYCTIAAICEAIAIFRSGAVTDYGIIKLKRGATSGRPTHDRHREGGGGERAPRFYGLTTHSIHGRGGGRGGSAGTALQTGEQGRAREGGGGRGKLK